MKHCVCLINVWKFVVHSAVDVTRKIREWTMRARKDTSSGAAAAQWSICSPL